MSSELLNLWLQDVHPSWFPTLDRVRPELEQLAHQVSRLHRSGVTVAPTDLQVLRSLRAPLEQVKVLILGQDPYPTAGHAVGWAFSVDAQVRPLPASLRNIFTELASDLGVEAPRSGDLSGWVDQGVMLLNRVLTVRVGEAGSMRNFGWERVTLEIVRTLVAGNLPLVAILWGADAQQVSPELVGVHVISSAHPSPLSAHRGFFGSRPFSRTNVALGERGVAPIVWSAERAVPTLW